MSNDPTTSTHVVATDFDGGDGVLVDLNTKKYYQLNETAMLIWRGLSQSKPVQDIIADVTANYEVTAEHAARSVDRVVNDFRNYDLLSRD
ncbi:MAG TPA: PqqD family protein [Pyrinomonadaceae bacterium]